MDNTEEIDEKYFAQVMKEIRSGYKDDGLEGKAIAMSGGDESKANSIYVQLRAEVIQRENISEQIEKHIEEIKGERRKKEAYRLYQ